MKFVIEEQSVIEIFNPKLDPKVGRILIVNDSAIWCGCGKDPPVAIEGTQRERTNARVSRAKRAGVHRIARVKSKESWSAQNCECQEPIKLVCTGSQGASKQGGVCADKGEEFSLSRVGGERRPSELGERVEAVWSASSPYSQQ